MKRKCDFDEHSRVVRALVWPDATCAYEDEDGECVVTIIAEAQVQTVRCMVLEQNVRKIKVQLLQDISHQSSFKLPRQPEFESTYNIGRGTVAWLVNSGVGCPSFSGEVSGAILDLSLKESQLQQQVEDWLIPHLGDIAAIVVDYIQSIVWRSQNYQNTWRLKWKPSLET